MRSGVMGLIAAVGLVVMVQQPGFAQSGYPKVEIFGGYHLIGTYGGPYHGWNATVSGNLDKSLGVAASISGNYKDGYSVHSFLAGPEFSTRPYSYGARIFGNILFGVSRRSAGFAGLEGSKSAFSVATMVGIELTLSEDEHLCYRLVQAGYQYSKFPGPSQNQFLISTGIVWKLGK